METIRLLLEMGKPRIMALVCLLTLGGATLSPHLLSPDFPATPLSGSVLFRTLELVLPGLFSPPAWSVIHAFGAVLVAALLWLGAAVINDVADQEIDAIRRPGRPLPSRRIQPVAAVRWALGAELLALGLVLLEGTRGAVLLTAAGALLGDAYSVPPLCLRKNGVAANLAIGTGAALAILGGQMAEGSVSQTGVLSALALGMLAAAVSMVKDFRDVAVDREHGIQTFPVLVGLRGAAVINLCAVAFAYLVTLFLLVEHVGLVWPVIEPMVALAAYNLYILARFLGNPYPGYAGRAYRRVLVLFVGVTALYVGAQATL